MHWFVSVNLEAGKANSTLIFHVYHHQSVSVTFAPHLVLSPRRFGPCCTPPVVVKARAVV